MNRQQIEDYVSAATAALGVPIRPEHREGVIANLETIFAQANGLMAQSLLPADEAAPVFRAGESSG